MGKDYNKRYYDEYTDRKKKKEVFERNADIYLRLKGFRIEINPKEEDRAFDRFILNNLDERIAGFEYKGKGCDPPNLLLDDSVFNNIIRWATIQEIPREKLFIGYYYGYDPNRRWIIFRCSDLIANGLGKSLPDLEYRSPSVMTYDLKTRRHLILNLDEVYQELYPNNHSADYTHLVDFMKVKEDS